MTDKSIYGLMKMEQIQPRNIGVKSMKTNIKSLHVGLPNTLKYEENSYVSAVRKQMTKQAFLSNEGFDGDAVANRKNHGVGHEGK